MANRLNQWTQTHKFLINKIKLPSTRIETLTIVVIAILKNIKQTRNYINEKNLMNPLQSGFRIGHSTTTALTKICHEISCSYERNETTIFILLDVKKAFDLVNHDILLKKLLEMIKSSSKTDLTHRKAMKNIHWSDINIPGYSKEKLEDLLYGIVVR